MIETVIPATRYDLPAAFIQMDLTGAVVEVGTYEGQYAAHWLTSWPGTLHCVDPFLPQEDWKDMLNGDEAHWADVRGKAEHRLNRWLRTGRCELHVMTSVEAARQPWATDLDGVYLDARHDATSVRKDLEAWWPTIRPGGVISGHDYLDAAHGQTLFEVRSTVRRWVHDIGYPIDAIRVTDDPPYPSWMLRKAE